MKLKVLTFMIAITASFAASARSILYYYDFNNISNGSLVYSGINKGTGSYALTAKNVSGSVTPYTTAGAFGSGGAFCSASQNALWLGDGSNSLGCGTRSGGFTISMWLKLNTSHPAWTDCFGWRIGGTDYRLEHTSNNAGGISVYRSKSTHCGGFTLKQGVWTHVALVYSNGLTAQGNADVYVDGDYTTSLTVATAGNLQQIHFGSWVRQDGSDRKLSANNTGIDDFAIFDYPATAGQVKWLAKYQPAQPATGPGRAMPYAYLFHEAVDATNNGVQLYNGGTGKQSIYKWTTGYAQFAVGAHNTNFCYWVRPGTKTALRLDNIEDVSIGRGFTLAFQLKSDALSTLWRDFAGFVLGGRGYRFEWNALVDSQPGFCFYNTAHGGATSGGNVKIVQGAWHAVAVVWNHATQLGTVYVDGEPSGVSFAPQPASGVSDSQQFTTLTIGPRVPRSKADTGTAMDDMTLIPSQNTYLDDVALYNYSFSPEQVQWLTNNVPNLPPLDATNLVRTVSANAAWAGTTAGWTVDGTTRRTIYPTLEDLDVTAAATFASNCTFTVDTFVTAKEVSFAAAADATPTVTLAFASGSRFQPTTLKLGAGLTTKLALYTLNTTATLDFATGTKVLLDVSNYVDANTALTCGGMTFPEGTTDVDSFFETTDPTRFAAVVAADRKSVTLKILGVATAEWTRGAGTDDVSNPANWTCYDADGTVIADALPGELTTIVVRDGATCNFVEGQTPTYYAVRMDANAKLGADCDWRGLGEVKFAAGTSLDLGGHSLTTAGTRAPFTTATITDTVGNGALHVDVAEGVTLTNSTVAYAGKLALVKDGAGTLCAAYPAQTYAGGTQVTAGEMKYGTANRPLGAVNVTNTVEQGATLDMNGYYNTSTCIYSWRIAGTIEQTLSNVSLGWDASARCFGRDLILTGDHATIRGGCFYFGSPSAVPAYLTSNGHTLTMDANNYIGVGEWRDTDAGGKIVWTGTKSVGMFEALKGYGCRQTTSVFTNVHVKLLGTWEVGGFEYAHNTWQCNSGTPCLQVFGRYRAGAMRPRLQLQNGATLDLTGETAAFCTDGLRPTTTGGTTTFTETGAVDFATDATVTVDVSGRSLTNGEQVVAWSAKPEGPTFVWNSATAAQNVPLCVGTFGIYYGADEESTVVDRAVWTGEVDGDVANPANWNCYNLAGHVVTNGLPVDVSTVYLTGSIDLQIPRGKMLAYAVIVCNNVSLAADCDWSGLTTAQEISTTIDVAGHTLTLPQLTGSGTITSSVAGGVLDVNVAEGLTLTNSTVTLTGATKLALRKSGKGTLVMQKANTGLGSTTVTVSEGFLKKWPETDSLGTDGTRVHVQDGAQFDLNGRTGSAYYRFTIAGSGPDGTGALVNNGVVSESWTVPDKRGFLHSITLGADATIGGDTSWIMASWNNQRHSMVLNGHTVTFTQSHPVYTGQLHFIGEGGIKVNSGCTVEIYPYTISATNCALEVSGTLQNRNFAVTGLKDLAFTPTGYYYAYQVCTETYTVFERYSPNVKVRSGSLMTSPRVQLGDATHLATTLDLNNFSEPFGATNTTFYAGSTVTVDVAERTALRNHARIATWTTQPANVTFKADSVSRRRGLRVLADSEGLVVGVQALVILIR